MVNYDKNKEMKIEKCIPYGFEINMDTIKDIFYNDDNILFKMIIFLLINKEIAKKSIKNIFYLIWNI